MRAILIFSAFCWLVISCGGDNTSSYIETPGDRKTGKDKALNAGADLIQDKTPLKQFNTYLDGFHFYNGNMDGQMEAHHYVSQVNADLYQAIIFDGNGADARLMGVEYIITPKLFATLPEEEKKLWHSHVHEVKSGSLIAPGIPEAAEHELMEKIAATYGKTIHTWHTDQQRQLPLGSPMLMMGFTKDGQLRQELIDARDKRFKIATEKIREKRVDIHPPAPDRSANAWEKGEIRQFVVSKKADSAANMHHPAKHRRSDD